MQAAQDVKYPPEIYVTHPLMLYIKTKKQARRKTK